MNKPKVSEESNGETKALDARQPETIDGVTGLPAPAPRTIKLSDLRDVRLELAHVYRAIDAGLIPSHEGTKRAYVLKTIGDILVIAEFEKRLQELEDRYEAQRSEAGRRASGLPSRDQPALSQYSQEETIQ